MITWGNKVTSINTNDVFQRFSYEIEENSFIVEQSTDHSELTHVLQPMTFLAAN